MEWVSALDIRFLHRLQCRKNPLFLFLTMNFRITFLMFFLFGQALQAIAFWITTICESSNSAYTVAFSILLVSVVLQSFLTTSYITFMFFLVESPIWFLPIRILFLLVPSYNFAVIFGQIALKSGRHYNMDDNYWELGPGYNYNDLFIGNHGDLLGIKFNVIVLIKAIKLLY